MGHCAGACADADVEALSCSIGHLAGPAEEEADGCGALWSIGQRAGVAAGAEETDCDAV